MGRHSLPAQSKGVLQLYSYESNSYHFQKSLCACVQALNQYTSFAVLDCEPWRHILPPKVDAAPSKALLYGVQTEILNSATSYRLIYN